MIQLWCKKYDCVQGIVLRLPTLLCLVTALLSCNGQEHTTTAKATADQNASLKLSCFSDSCITRILSNDSNFHDLNITSFHTTGSRSGTIAGNYTATYNWQVIVKDDTLDNGDFLKPRDYKLYYSVDIGGNLTIDSSGKVLYYSRDTLTASYRSGCGFKDGDYRHFNKSADIWFDDIEINSISYTCDTIFLYDRPFGKRVGAINSKKTSITTDLVAEQDDDGSACYFARVVDGANKTGYWVEVYSAMKTKEFTKKTGYYTSSHYSVNLVDVLRK